MKKKLYSLFILFLLILLTGCGKKVLKCNKNIMTSDNIVVDHKIVLEYRNKKMKNQKMIISYKTSNEVESLKESLEEQYSEYKGKRGIKYYFKDTDEGFDFVIDVNMRFVSDKVINELDLQKRDRTTAYYNLKDQGYICE